jgi:shikimate kinase
MIERPAPQTKILGSVTGPQQRRRVVLIGFMGAGKTTAGKALAERLRWTFYDLDELIEQQEQRSIAEIFDKSGENGFRKIESSALLELLERSEDSCVIALGGGAFVQPQNRKALEQARALTVLLSAPVEELQRRCEASGDVRPLARSRDEFERLFSTRQEAYALAQFQVETLGKRIEQVAEEIERLLEHSI